MILYFCLIYYFKGMDRILIIDDDPSVRQSFVKIIKTQKLIPIEAENGVSALNKLSEKPSVVLLDIHLPDVHGLELLSKIKESDPLIPVIIVSGSGDIHTAVEAIKLGAYDYVVKPPDLDKLLILIQRAIENYHLKKQVHAIDTSFENILGTSPSMKKVIKQINQVAQSDFSVVLQGDTGTGKTFIANMIHNLSSRSKYPFVKVDIGSIPETLIESELFGHEKGAFTGAVNQKKGFFQLANKGTLFIDELENMSPHIQAKLLNVVEDRKYYPVGSTNLIETDLRIITATNTDIKKSVRENNLREDLFYRLGEFLIVIPPLKERMEDISFFSNKFLLEASNDLGKNINEISTEAMNILQQYPWHGNIRELRTVIKKAVLFADGEIITKDQIEFLNQFKDNEKTSVQSLSLREVVQDTEMQTITRALKIAKGNKSQAARLLEVNYKTLLSKLKEYHIDIED